MPIDDVAVRPFQPELFEDLLADLFIVVVGVVGVLRLRPGRLIRHQPPFEGSDMVPSKKRRVASAPEEPEEVLPELLLRGAGFGVIPLPRDRLGMVEKRPAGKLLASDAEFEEIPFRIHRDTPMEEQVAVVALIEAALGIEEFDMPLKLLAAQERVFELIHQLGFLFGKLIRRRGEDGWEIPVEQRIFGVPETDRPLFKVDLVEQQPVLHPEGGVAQDRLPLKFEQDYRNLSRKKPFLALS